MRIKSLRARLSVVARSLLSCRATQLIFPCLLCLALTSQADATTPPRLSAGSNSTMVLRGDGSLWSFGYNNYGSLGDGTSTNRDIPVAVQGLGGGAIGMAASRGTHALAIRGDGIVFSWGQNNYGQLGDGTLADHLTPQAVSGLTNVKSVVVSPSGYSVAVKTDGTVWAWGYNAQKQLGDGTTTNRSLPVQVKDAADASGNLSNIKEIAIRGDGSAIALKNDGTVWNWGYNLAAPTQVADITTATAIAVGYSHTLVLLADGTLWSYGDDYYGQLGDSSVNSSGATLRQVVDAGDASGKLTGVVAISARYYQSFAVKRDGTLWSWGYNGYGQLGDGTTTNRFLPAQVKDPLDGSTYLSGVTDVAAGDNHTAALKSDGSLYSWGYNGYSQLGDNTAHDRLTPIAVHDSANIAYFNATNATGSSGCGNCTTAGWTPSAIPGLGARLWAGGGSFAIRADGSLYAWGYNSDGRLGLGDTTNRDLPVLKSDITNVVAVSEWGDHGVALKNDGTVWSWGKNSYGQLGDGTLTDRFTAGQVSGLTNVVAVAAGANFSVALKSDGSIWSWGYNYYGQLGDGSSTDSRLPVQVKYFADAKKIVLGGYNNNSVYALKGDGTVWAWGYGFSNQAEPVSQLSGVSDIKDISAGYSHVLILKNDNTVWSYGDDGYGQLGDSSAYSGGDPLRQVLSGVSAISAKNYQSFALKQDGTLWAWGYNGNGQLGDGTTTNRFVPVQVTGLGSVVDFAAGSDHTLALKSDGTIWAWGYNYDGRVGDNTSIARLTPVQVHDPANLAYLSGTGTTVAVGCGNCTLPTWALLAQPSVPLIIAGDNSSFGINTGHALTAWGYNGDSRLGDGTTTNRNTPVQTLTDTITVTQRGSHGMALKSDGTVWSWGQNNYGQLGDGTTTTRPAPVAVSGLAGIVAIATGDSFSVALKNDGTLWSWGYNYYGQLGDGTTSNQSIPVQVRYLSGVTMIRTNGSTVYAMKSDGTFWRWGYGFTNQPEPVAQLSGVTGISDLVLGDSHVLILKSDNSVWSYGDDSYGQLGDSSAYSGGDTLRQVMTGVSAIAARRVQSFALKIDGTLWSWGYNGDGQLGDGTTTNRFVPTQVKDPLDGTTYLSGIVSLSAGYSHTLALKANGQVYAFGSNPYGELGLASTTASSSAIAVHGIADSGTLNVGVPSDGIPNPFAFTAQSGVALNATVTSNEIVVTGITTSAAISITGGQYSINGGTYTSTAGSVVNGDRVTLQITAAATGFTTTNALLSIAGVRGIFSITTLSYFARNPILTASGQWSAGLRSDGTAWAWGQIGTGVNATSMTPSRVPALDDFASMVSGLDATSQPVWYQLKRDGTVWTRQALYAGPGVTTDAPVQISGLAGIVAISAATSQNNSGSPYPGAATLVAVKSDGSVWVLNGSPEQVTGITNAVDVHARADHIVVRTADSTVWTWGDNRYGQLGHDSSALPQQVPGLADVAAVDASDTHVVALKSDGSVYSWGRNDTGQLGDGTFTDKSVPTLAEGVNGIAKIAAGIGHTLAMKTDGTVWAWGYNAFGQVGDGTDHSRTAPTAVAGLNSVISIAAGDFHSLALKSDGSVWSWGQNAHGQIGDGTVTMRLIPARILGVWGYNFLDLIHVDSVTVGRIDITGSGIIPENTGEHTYSATAMLTDGSALNISPIWSTSDPSVAVIDARSGILTTGEVSVDTALLVIASYISSDGVVRSTSKTITVVNSAPILTLSSGSLSLVSQTIGQGSSPQILTISNGGTVPFTVGSITISGSDFAKTSDTCATVAPGGSCSVSIVFTPQIAGNQTGTLVIVSNAPGTPHTVSLVGTGPTPTDITGPVLLLTNPVNGAVSNNATLNISGAVTDASGVRSLTINNASVTLSTGGSFSHSITLAAGVNTITFIATDIPGNSTSVVRTVTYAAAVNGVCGISNGATFNVTPSAGLCTSGTASAITGSGPWNWNCSGLNGGIDAACSALIGITGPALTVSTLANGAITNNATVNISGTVSDISGIVSLTINGTTVPVTDGSFSYVMTLQPGANSIVIIASNNLGDSSGDSRTVSLDVTAPILTVTGPADNSVTNQALATIAGTINETSTVTAAINSGTLQNASIVGSDYSVTVNLATGLNNISITATDRAGNTSNAVRSVTYDNSKPSLAITEPNQDITTAQASIIISGTVSDTISNPTVTVTLNGRNYTPAITSSTFSQQLTIPAEGTYTITATATDEAGNSSSVTRNVIYAIPADVTAPSGVIFTIPTTSPTFTVGVSGFSASDNVGVTSYLLTENSALTDQAWTEAVPTKYIFKNWGYHTLYAYVKDAAGNISAPATNRIYIGTNPEADGVLKGSPAKYEPLLEDALKSLNFAMKVETPTASDILHGDVAPLVEGIPQPDGVLNLGDTIIILRRVVGL